MFSQSLVIQFTLTGKLTSSQPIAEGSLTMYPQDINLKTATHHVCNIKSIDN